MTWLKALFSFLGFASLFYILQSYGFGNLSRDFTSIGWQIFPLSLTFIPTLLCYALAWLSVTEISSEQTQKSLLLPFFRMTVISIAWNNLSPFVKVLGEPVKAVLLEKYISRKRAIKSVVIYNIVHLIGTVGAFLLAALLIPFLFPVTENIRWICFTLVGICLLLTLFLFTAPRWAHGALKKRRFQRLRKVSLHLRWSFHKIQFFYRNHRAALLFSVTLEIFARFVEGITFYYAYRILQQPISALSAAFLDVGRALADNVFFFIPYQVGSREWSVGFITESVLGISATGFVTAALLYRLVEIFWMILGYILWTSAGKSAKSLK